jgi:hypothetical protein
LRILIHAVHYPVCSARYAADAFTRLGHEVRHVGLETGRDIWGLALPEKYIWPQNPPEAGWIPDLCILMDTAYQWHHPSAPTVIWSVDNHVRNLRPTGISVGHQPGIAPQGLPLVAHYFLAHFHGPAQPISSLDETWLPCGYDPRWHTPSSIPFEAREYDVALIGVMYPQRVQLVEALRGAGLKVLAGTGLVYDQYVAAYHNARISLCVSACGDVAQRVFETAAMGCVVMSDDCADFAILRPKGLWIYDPATVVDEAQAILAQPQAAIANIEFAKSWARPHTWDSRAQLLLETWAEHAGMKMTS